MGSFGLTPVAAETRAAPVASRAELPSLLLSGVSSKVWRSPRTYCALSVGWVVLKNSVAACGLAARPVMKPVMGSRPKSSPMKFIFGTGGTPPFQ